VTAKYCRYAVWQADRERLIDIMRDRGLLSPRLLSEYFTCWWYVLLHSLGRTNLSRNLINRRYENAYTLLSVVESIMDFQAYLQKSKTWVQGLWRKGFQGAHDAAFGLPERAY